MGTLLCIGKHSDVISHRSNWRDRGPHPRNRSVAELSTYHFSSVLSDPKSGFIVRIPKHMPHHRNHLCFMHSLTCTVQCTLYMFTCVPMHVCVFISLCTFLCMYTASSFQRDLECCCIPLLAMTLYVVFLVWVWSSPDTGLMISMCTLQMYSICSTCVQYMYTCTCSTFTCTCTIHTVYIVPTCTCTCILPLLTPPASPFPSPPSLAFLFSLLHPPLTQDSYVQCTCTCL